MKYLIILLSVAASLSHATKLDSKYQVQELSLESDDFAGALSQESQELQEIESLLDEQLQAIQQSIAPYIGIVLIVVGGLFLFVGATFILFSLGAVAFFVSSYFIFIFVYGFLPQGSTSKYALIGLIIGSTLVGLAAAFVASKFAKHFGTTVVGVGGGVALALFILTFAKVTAEWITIVSCVAAGLIGGILGNKYNKQVRCIGTSLIGSFILVRGVAFYVGNWPTKISIQLLSQSNAYLYGYAGAIVGLSIIGSIVQLILFRDEGKDNKDEFENQEESRTCGCF